MTSDSVPVLRSSWRIAALSKPQDGLPHYDRQPTDAQQYSISRAMRSYILSIPVCADRRGEGRSKRLYLYEPADPLSAAWAKLAVERRDFVPFSKFRRSVAASAG